jgi:hypothetical protein
MQKIKLAGQDDKTGQPCSVETEAEMVPGTDGLFAVHRDELPPWEEEDAPAWVLTHVPSGHSGGRYTSSTDAMWVARQIYAAAPDACRLSEGKAFVSALPDRVLKWVLLMRQASGAGVPFQLLKGCAEYVRESEELFPAG